MAQVPELVLEFAEFGVCCSEGLAAFLKLFGLSAESRVVLGNYVHQLGRRQLFEFGDVDAGQFFEAQPCRLRLSWCT